MSRTKPHQWKNDAKLTALYKGQNTKVKVCKVCKCKSFTNMIGFKYSTVYILGGEHYNKAPDCKK